MIHKITLKPNQAAEIVKTGQFIKVLNCENRFKLNATRQGSEVAFTDAGAGFDLSTITPFDKIAIQSEVNQTVEIWVSAHKLSYDALSTKPSRSSSFLSEHFGLTGLIAPYDPAQASLKVALTEKGFWVGGEGVTSETGIYIPQGEVYKHDSAAPLYAYINDKPDLVLDTQNRAYLTATTSDQCRKWAVNGEAMIFLNQGNSGRLVDLSAGDVSVLGFGYKCACAFEDGFFVAGGMNYSLFNKSGMELELYNPLAGQGGGYHAVACIESSGGVLVCVKSLAQASVHAAFYYKDGVFSKRENIDQKLKDNEASGAYRDEIDGRIWVKIGNAWYFSEDELITLEKAMDVATGTTDKPVFSNKYVCFTANSSAKVYKRQTGEVIDVTASIGSPMGVAAVGDAIIVIKGDTIYITEDEFISYNIAYKHDRIFAGYLYGMFDVIESELIAWVNDGSDPSGLLKFTLKPDLTKPKAKFRVFKELY
ncbi:hypothetical protein EU508_09160 [Pseudoalteromonas fuliginea]|uniref:Uncharacterized protein n=1 Tax=Pseudoalteromonas fuliginea TaxID=1872678 RepID=A0AB73BHB6_9GAMM|nr:hypothetical protein [Pseudoalteromonas fuliginea]KAA1160615.1 hypothetical protein EU508_09160 [Pseudoalteromonas fuliginea]